MYDSYDICLFYAAKIATCFHCKIRKNRLELLVCSKCRRQQYCSQECQLKDWKDHKEFCKGWYKRDSMMSVKPREELEIQEGKGMERT